MATFVDMPEIDEAIDAESFDWLDENVPLLARAVSRQIQRAHTPEQIRRYVMKRTQRPALAARCEQAARHLQREDAQ